MEANTILRTDAQLAANTPWVNPFYAGDDGLWYLRMNNLKRDIPVSRSYVILILDKGVSQLTLDEQGDLFSPTMSAQIREKLAVDFNKTLEEVEIETAERYAGGFNPLPWLQNMLGDLVDVQESCPAGTPDQPVLVCERTGGRVYLRQVVMGKDSAVKVYDEAERLAA